MWPIPLPAADAKRANAYVVNRQVMELIRRWEGKKRDVSSEETGALHLKGPGLEFITKKATAPMAAFGKKPPGIAELLDAAERARKEGKSLVLASDHTGNIQIGVQEELNHALQASLVPGKGADDHLGSRLSEFFKLNDAVKALDALDMIYRFDSLGNAAAEIGVRLMAAGRHEEMSLTEAEAARLAEVYGRLLEEEHGATATEEIRGRIQSAYGNYGRGS